MFTSTSVTRQLPMIRSKSGIVWIASYPKSGTTWVRMFLFNLVRIRDGADEPQNINDLEKFSPWDVARWRYSKFFNMRQLTNPLEEAAVLRHRVQQDIVRERTGHVFVKTHWPLGQMYGHSSIDHRVTSGAAYIVRNPLDIAISFAHQMSATIDETIKLMSTENVYQRLRNATPDLFGSWSQNVASWTRESNPEICILRYEDLLQDPEQWFSVLSRHVFPDRAPTADQISAAISRSAFDQLKAQEQKFGFRGKADKHNTFFREGRAGQWKERLTPRQIDRIVGDHGAQMERFGYLPHIQ